MLLHLSITITGKAKKYFIYWNYKYIRITNTESLSHFYITNRFQMLSKQTQLVKRHHGHQPESCLVDENHQSTLEGEG
jgi:hypothetical protein